MVLLAIAAIRAKRGLKPRVLKIPREAGLCDFFVIASARSVVHLSALTQAVEENLEKNGFRMIRRETGKDSPWSALDFSAMVVHLFHERTREFYNLESLWGNAVPLTKFNRKTHASKKD